MSTVSPEIDFGPDELPAYGQVWRWGKGTQFMLITERAKTGQWLVCFLPGGTVEHGLPMSGLHDDRQIRLDGYRRIE